MFLVDNEGAESRLFTLDKTGKHAFMLSPELKHRRSYDETMVVIDSFSPKTQAKDDNESVRKKFCDSLTSALEMVVSKQLVKSVLGVVNDLKVTKLGDLSRRGQFKAQDGLTVEGIIESEAVSRVYEDPAPSLDNVSESNEIASLHVDFRDGMETKAESKDDATHLYVTSSSTVNEAENSALSKINSGREERTPFLQKKRGGLELMEQAQRVACNVELNLFSVNGGVNRKYREKARSLLFNLKDKSNPELRARVFDGEIAPEILVHMSAEQLASKQLSQWRTAKAEEFASMVFLTDADVDPRRIVKKTHKGEFQLVAEELHFSSTLQSTSPQPAVDVVVDEDVEETKRGYRRVGRRDTKCKISNGLSLKEDEIQGPEERRENDILERDATVNDVPKYLCTVDTCNGSVSERTDEHQNADAVGEDGTVDTFDFMPAASSCRNRSSTKLLVSWPLNCTPKLSKVATTRCTESGGVKGSSSFDVRECGTAVWEGSIHLSATRYALINGFYRSGERLEVKDWPRSVDVKGRVRLVALDRFLQDLQLSRSRTVTILSLCPSDCQGEVKQSTAYLQEMADQYRTGGRAGFVEPVPGFELYLLAPSSLSIEPLRLEDLRSINSVSKREYEVLVGVVVWRKVQPQGPASSRGPNQNVNVKEVAISNLVCESHTKANAKPIHCTETRISGGWLPASQNTAIAPFLANVRGNSSMHATEPHGDSSDFRHPPISRDWQEPSPPAIGHHVTTKSAHITKIAENAHFAVANSSSILNQSVDLVDDVPPGFLPPPPQSSCQLRSAALNVDLNDSMQGCDAPPPHLGSVTGRVSLIPYGSKTVSKDSPPGFSLLSSLINRKGTQTIPEEDDLPEFNFDAEGVLPQARRNYSSPVLGPLSAPTEPLAALHLMGNASNQNYVHNLYDLHPPLTSYYPMVGGIPERHRVHVEESFVQSVSSGCGWSNGDRRAEELPTMVGDVAMAMVPVNDTHQRNLFRSLTKDRITGEVSMDMLLSDGTDHRIPQFKALSDVTVTGEDKSCTVSHEANRICAPLIPVPIVFPSSHLPCPGWTRKKVVENRCPRYEDSRGQTASLLSHSGQPSLPPVLRDHPFHSSQQLSLVHMVVQRQHSVMKKNRAFKWLPRGATLPQQEAWREEQQDAGNSPAKWQHRNAEKFRRKLEQRESCNKNKDSPGNLKISSREAIHVRDCIQECALISSLQRGQKRQATANLTTTSEIWHTKEALRNSEFGTEIRAIKPVKRGRERERDQ